ncbi:MAG: endonuclease/exonuclease/phosphatase family metal-dependent hydrolase [Saprospiraceae bacterium]|jgi:endonuclease/exonuclease/phosphatase family metal-dependent hydrolase
MKRFLKFLWKWLVILVLTYTFISVISSYIPPKYFWGLFFLSYSVPLVVGINLAMLLLNLLFKNHFWPIALSTVVAIFGISNNWSWSNDTNDGTANYSVMSYNVRLFDLYNWLDGKNWDGWKARTDNGATLDSLYSTITESNADFVCIQEYFNQKKGEYQSTKYLKDQGYKYAHTAYSYEQKINQYGIATFSKYPIINKSVIYFKNSKIQNGIQLTDVKIHSDTLRIINVHMQSFKLGRSDYEYLNTLSDSTLQKIDSKPTKELFKKIKYAFIQRSEQLDELLSIVRESPHPILLCGDFNELPNSYLYRAITYRLSDSFQEVGKGFGSTFVSNVPGLRIDYVFHSPRLKTVSHRVVKRKLSDHYPTVVEFKFLSKAN